MHNGNSFVWLESTGGPLILLEDDLVGHWRGYLTRSDSGVTDYERACQISDYLGTVGVASRSGVVLGEEPYSTTWWQSRESDRGLLVRWVCAEDEGQVIDALTALSNGDWERTGVELKNASGRLLLFDSASPGFDIDTFLLIELPKGSYQVETLHYNPDLQTSLILHRFVSKVQ